MAILGIDTLTNNGPTHVRDGEPLALVFAQEHGAGLRGGKQELAAGL
jgi:hypothetical protein